MTDDLVADEYGNTESDPFEFCTFPDCGCDGARLCQARSGPNSNAQHCNCENMYNRGDKQAVRAKMGLYALASDAEL